MNETAPGRHRRSCELWLREVQHQQGARPRWGRRPGGLSEPDGEKGYRAEWARPTDLGTIWTEEGTFGVYPESPTASRTLPTALTDHSKECALPVGQERKESPVSGGQRAPNMSEYQNPQTFPLSRTSLRICSSGRRLSKEPRRPGVQRIRRTGRLGGDGSGVRGHLTLKACACAPPWECPTLGVPPAWGPLAGPTGTATPSGWTEAPLRTSPLLSKQLSCPS